MDTLQLVFYISVPVAMILSLYFYFRSYSLKYTAELGGNTPMLRKSSRCWYLGTMCAIFSFGSFLLIGILKMLNS